MERTSEYLILAPLFERAWAEKITMPHLIRDDRLAKATPRACFISDENGDPISALISISRMGSTADTRHIAYLFTAPDLRNNGLAEHLLEEYTNAADQRGIGITASISKRDTSVRRLFSRAGFQELSSMQSCTPDTHVWVQHKPLLT